MVRIRVYTGIAVLLLAGRTWSTEPNETFATATVLLPGVLSVSDALGDLSLPIADTVLGIRDHFSTIYRTDDDGSFLGDGTASGLGSVSTNSGSIDFSISGYPDFDFEGLHSEQGSTSANCVDCQPGM